MRNRKKVIQNYYNYNNIDENMNIQQLKLFKYNTDIQGVHLMFEFGRKYPRIFSVLTVLVV